MTKATVWKYLLAHYDGSVRPITINMPEGAQVIHVGLQRGDFCLWALVQPDEHLSERRFNIYGTGWDIDNPDDLYLGTVTDGEFVWHIFEEE